MALDSIITAFVLLLLLFYAWGFVFTDELVVLLCLPLALFGKFALIDAAY